MNSDPFCKMLTLLERLDQSKIPYEIRHSRDDAIMIIAYAPGQYWEMEILRSGEIEIERYQSDGHIYDESILQELFALWSDDPVKDEPSENINDAIVR